MIILLFFIRSGLFFRLGLSMGSRNLNFSVNSLRSSAVFGGRLKCPSPCRIRSSPSRDRVRGLSETSEKCANIYILGGIRPSYSWILAYAELERKKHRGKHLFPSWHHFQSGFSFRPHHTFCMGTPRSVWLIVVSFRYRISRLNTFVRAFVVFQGGCSLPNDIITPSVRADFSS